MDFDSLPEDQQAPQPQATPPPVQAPLSFDSLPDDSDGAPKKFDDLTDDAKYSTPGQQIGSAAEGLAQGFAGPLATAGELGLSKLGVPNMTAEDIKGRETANPIKHGIGEAAGFGAGMLTGTGEAGVVSNIAKRFTPEAASVLGKVGATAINGAIQSGLFQGANEWTKGLLGQSDPNHPVASALANVGAASLFGAGTGGLLGGIGQATGNVAGAVEKLGVGKKVNDLLTGVGLASVSTPEQISSYLAADNPQMAKYGLKLYNIMQNHIAQGIGGGIVANALPFGNDSAMERIAKDAVGTATGAVLGPKVSKAMAPIVLKIVGSGVPQGAEQSINYALKSLQGANKVSKGIDQLFNYGTSKAVDLGDPGSKIDKIKEYIKNGGIDSELQPQPQVTPSPDGYADGGEVVPEQNPPAPDQQGGLAAHFPEQNMLLNAAKSRISNYLKTQQPMPLNSKRPFDTDHIDPNKERQYHRVVELAAQPLSILNHVKSGRLTAEHMQAFSSMYPELHDQLKKKMMEKVVDSVHDKEKPPYHMRQSLSLFMGEDLDSTLTQQNMAAAQMVFIQQNNQKQQESASKMSGLVKSAKSAMTPQQGAQERLNKN